MSTPAPVTTPATFLRGHFVGGRLFAGRSGRQGPVHDPATGALRGHVAFASADETRAAIAAAEAALPAWSEVTPLQRARVMFRFKALLEQHADELALTLTSEHGKVLSDARGELTRGIEVVEFACGIPQLLKSEFTESVGTGVDSWSIRQPVGVCAGITPFNFPAMVPMWMFPVAIACGNTFVLKPSEKDPSVPLRVAELLSEAGLPDGVFNVVNGDREAVDTLLTDPRVAAVSFVGSTPVAEYIYRTASAHGKRVQALGGAKNHMVVLPDADTRNAASALVGAAYGSAGERCMAISVAVAVGEAGDRLVEAVKQQLAELKVAPGTAERADMGPLVTREHLERVRGYVDLGVEEGAALVVDARAGLRVGARARQCARVRQWCRDLHGERRGRACVHPAGAGGHGGRQRADPGADGVPLLRRLEAFAVRAAARARPRRRALLHAAQDRHRALAHRNGRGRSVRDADDEVTGRGATLRRPGTRCCRIPASPRAAVAQLDRASGFEPEGRGFESLRPRHMNQEPVSASAGGTGAMQAPCEQRLHDRRPDGATPPYAINPSLRLDDQVHHGRAADIEHFVPGDTGTRETAPGSKLDFARAARVGDPHAATGERVAEMSIVEVSLVPDAGRERAAEDSVIRILVQLFADRHAVPSGLERIGKRRPRRAGAEACKARGQ